MKATRLKVRSVHPKSSPSLSAELSDFCFCDCFDVRLASITAESPLFDLTRQSPTYESDSPIEQGARPSDPFLHSAKPEALKEEFRVSSASIDATETLKHSGIRPYEPPGCDESFSEDGPHDLPTYDASGDPADTNEASHKSHNGSVELEGDFYDDDSFEGDPLVWLSSDVKPSKPNTLMTYGTWCVCLEEMANFVSRNTHTRTSTLSSPPLVCVVWRVEQD